MGSTTSVPEAGAPEDGRPVIDMAELGATLAHRRATLGIGNPPRNAGARRTPAKRALLRAIKEAGGEW